MSNVKQILFLLAFSLISFSALAQTKCGQFEKEWGACAADEDCAPAHDACGWPAAYNKDFLENAENYNRCIAPMIECDAPKERKGDTAAVCRDGICGLPEEE